MQEVWVQHSNFTGVTQPNLRRGFPKAFPDLAKTKKQTGCLQTERENGHKGDEICPFLAEWKHARRDASKSPSCLEDTKSMCKLAGNDPATISSRRPEVPWDTE